MLSSYTSQVIPHLEYEVSTVVVPSVLEGHWITGKDSAPQYENYSSLWRVLTARGTTRVDISGRCLLSHQLFPKIKKDMNRVVIYSSFSTFPVYRSSRVNHKPTPRMKPLSNLCFSDLERFENMILSLLTLGKKTMMLARGYDSSLQIPEKSTVTKVLNCKPTQKLEITVYQFKRGDVTQALVDFFSDRVIYHGNNRPSEIVIVRVDSEKTSTLKIASAVHSLRQEQTECRGASICVLFISAAAPSSCRVH